MLSIKVKSVKPLPNMLLSVTFEENTIKTFDVKKLIGEYPDFEALENTDVFNLVQIVPGGYGVYWTEDLDCSEGELWEYGVV